MTARHTRTGFEVYAPRSTLAGHLIAILVGAGLAILAVMVGL